jgi:hypothetical protein
MSAPAPPFGDHSEINMVAELGIDWDTKGGSDLVKTMSNTAGRDMMIVAIVDQVIVKQVHITLP